MTVQIIEWVDWLPDSVVSYWEMLNQYPLLSALLIAVLSYIIAYIFLNIVLKGFKQLAKRLGIQLDDTISFSFRKPIFNTIFLTGLVIAVNLAQLPFDVDIIVNLLISLIALSWIFAGFRMCGTFLSLLARNQHRFSLIEDRTIPLLDLLIKLGIILFGSYFLLAAWGVNPLGWLASASILGIAVGFAAKDTLANLFSGFFILADTPYKVNDYINLDSGERGKVTQIGMRSTRMVTRDDIEITVPNAVIANAKIINESAGPWRKIRLRIQVSVSYNSDVDQVCSVLETLATEHNTVINIPEPRVRLRGFGTSSIDFELLCWISDPEERGRVSHELYMQIFKTFKKQGIEIPVNQQDIHIKEIPGGTSQ